MRHLPRRSRRRLPALGQRLESGQGLAVCLVGLGLVERDGLVVLGGLVIGMFGVAINAGFAYAVIAGIVGLLNL